MTQEDLANSADVAQSTVSRILSGSLSRVNPKTLVRITRALGLSSSDLFGEPLPEVERFWQHRALARPGL